MPTPSLRRFGPYSGAALCLTDGDFSGTYAGVSMLLHAIGPQKQSSERQIS
uniref:Uncharacterized protein n=1 Tax=Arundo donax TaxID=35708 RepID=A0A0A9BIK9_ARUDO